MGQGQLGSASGTALDEMLSVLRKDFSKLGVRIRTLEHTHAPPCPATTVRIHYPSLRNGQATMEDLTRLLSSYMMHFALPWQEIKNLRDRYGVIPPDDYEALSDSLKREAKRIFIKANKETNRNGEAGELLLYLLTEWILDAPQLLAKMRLKTNPNMPVHGADGIHVKFCKNTKRLLFYWGESKLYADVSAGIGAAMKSIREALSYEKLEHEFSLVKSYIDFSGLDAEAKVAILSYLDPLDERSNERANVTTCLVGFNFKGYADLKSLKPNEVEDRFRAEVLAQLADITTDVKDTMKKFGLEQETIEIFFLPVPAVQTFRDLFQAEIGWTP